MARQTQASLFVFSRDDNATHRGGQIQIPRDNVLIEFGLFSGIQGRDKAIICRAGAKLASDIQGILYVDLTLPNTAQGVITKWIASISPRTSEPLAQDVTNIEIQLLTRMATLGINDPAIAFLIAVRKNDEKQAAAAVNIGANPLLDIGHVIQRYGNQTDDVLQKLIAQWLVANQKA